MRFFIVALICIIGLIYSSNSFALYGNYDEFTNASEEKIYPKKILKGSFFRGFISQTVSSEYNNSGDFIKVLLNSDYILNDEILIPKNSYFIGQISNLQKAQRGQDGYFSINIIQLVLPDGKNYSTKGYIISSKKSKTFGGNFSRRAEYKTTLHRGTPVGRKGTLYLQQNGPRMMGNETKIKMGEMVTILIEEELNLD